MAEPYRLNGASFKRDKTGLVTIVQPWEVDTIADCDHFIPSVGASGTTLPVVDRSAEEIDIGKWKLNLTFQGLVAEPAAGTAIEVEFSGSMAQDPIKSHPGFAKLKEMYGWETLEDGKLGFPEFLVASGESGGLSGQQGSGLRRSDVFGTESWLVAEGTFRESYTVRNVPNSLLDSVGLIVDVPRYWNLLGLPNPRGRNWLKLLPKCERKGNATKIVQEYKLSAPGGGNKDIYGVLQFSRRGAGGGGGLESGGLVTGSLTTGHL